MEQFLALAAAAAARCAEEEGASAPLASSDLPTASALEGTAPAAAAAAAAAAPAPALSSSSASSGSSSRALAREEWLRKRDSHLEEARRAQQELAEREVAHYFSPEINVRRARRSCRAQRARPALWLRALTLSTPPPPP